MATLRSPQTMFGAASSYLRQVEQWMWTVRVFQKHPRQMSWRQFIPPAFVALCATLGTVALFTSIGRAALIALTATYLAVALVASFLVCWRTRPGLIPILPVVFATLH